MKKRAYILNDITHNDYELLKQAYFLRKNDEEAFVCFGRHFGKLAALEMVDQENQITYTGRQFVKFIMARLD